MKGKVSRLQRERHAIIEAMEKKVFEAELKIQEKKAAIRQKHQKLMVVESKLLNVAKKGGADSGTYKAEQHRLKMLRQLDALEHSNECAASYKNAAIGKNIEKKQEINDLRQVKEVYLEAFERMRKDIATAKKATEEQHVFVEQEYKLRDKSQVLCQSVLTEFNKRKTKLQEELDHLTEIEKAQKGEEEEEELSIKEMMGMESKAKKKNGKSSGKKTLKDTFKQMTFPGGKEEGKKMLITDIGYLNNLWKKIQKRTGLSSADELATVFLQMEQIKMQKMIEATDYIGKIKSLRAKIREIEDERLQYVQENKSRAKKQKDLVQTLQRRTEKVENEVEETEKKIQLAQVLLRSLVAPMRRLFAESDISKLSESLANVVSTSMLHSDMPPNLDDDSTSSALLSALASIEQRITEVMQIYEAFMQSHLPNSVKWNRRRKRGPVTERGLLKRSLARQQIKIVDEMSRRYPKEKANDRDRDYRFDRNAVVSTGEELRKKIKEEFSKKKMTFTNSSQSTI
eukprot:g6534.t1